MQVVALAPEDRVRHHLHDDVQVAVLPARIAALALAAEPDAHAVARACRDRHRQAAITDLHDALRAVIGFFERDLRRDFEVIAGHRPAGRALALEPAVAPKSAAENVAEEVGERIAAACAEVRVAELDPVAARLLACGPARPIEPARLAAHARPLLVALPQLVIFLALVLVGEDLIGLVNFLKALFRLRVAGIHVRVILARQFAIRFADVFVGGRPVHAKQFVVIRIIHRCY